MFGKHLDPAYKGTMQPTPDMMAVAEKLAGFIAGGGRDLPPDLFADGPVAIVENFPPYIFTGSDAVSRWAGHMRAHLDGLTSLTPEFGEAFDCGMSGDEAYFSLRTQWSGFNRGTPFRETGGWALVLARTPAGWRLKGYGWAVIRSTTGADQNTIVED